MFRRFSHGSFLVVLFLTAVFCRGVSFRTVSLRGSFFRAESLRAGESVRSGEARSSLTEKNATPAEKNATLNVTLAEKNATAVSAQPVWHCGVVAADHPLASAAGIEILRKGGNVVDAAVAVAFVLSVVRPESCGIGGGGFMLIWNAKTQQAVALDYRERAPQKARRNMYRDPANPQKALPELSRRGHRAVAVPGSVAGWCYAQKHYGRLSLATVMEPALRLCRQGVPVDSVMIRIQADLLRRFAAQPETARRFSSLKRLYLNNGKRWRQGDRFYSPQQKVLQRIARLGAAGFYDGPVAEALVQEMRRGGGLIRRADLAAMQPVVRQPLRGTFDGRTLLVMPPPSSGGVALLQMLNTLQAYERQHKMRLEKTGHNSAGYVHLLTEAMKHAFADRAAFLGDADFVRVPVRKLIGTPYAGMLARKIDPARTFPPAYYGRFQPVADGGTSHFSVLDADGNAVACTETINLAFGSWVVEPTFGIVLNNEMDDFAALPGQPNAFGLIQSAANAVAPRKKPLSSMSPTIVLQQGKAELALGASGGPRIISSTLQVLLNVLRFGMPPQRAVAAPRFHHQWQPDVLFVEPGIPEKTRRGLTQRGHKLQQREKLSATQAAGRNGGKLLGGSDPRKSGQPAGY